MEVSSAGARPGGARGRLDGLMAEFRRRQRTRPDLVVRPWWGAEAGRRVSRSGSGFVVEYCPRGVASAELAVRRDRVRVEGPAGMEEAPLDLESGWRLGGSDCRCPETLVNHLLAMADRVLEEVA